jgi:peptidoglycan/xylan/chitin deacetylase (PgdA/CDA1 family)
VPTILTYHSQILSSNLYAGNDHIALAEDLRLIASLGLRIVPLSQVFDALDGIRDWSSLADAIVLTFDDGAILDWRDVVYPGLGPQLGFAALLRAHQAQGYPVSASSFVIASGHARSAMDRRSLFGLDWLSDDWWSDAVAEGLIDIESHGFDHDHPDVDPADPARGNFARIDDADACAFQIDGASREIERICGRRPIAFAYPYGQTSSYLRDTYLPANGKRLGLRGAVSTEPGAVDARASRWWLPRFVCNRDWNSTASLAALLNSA